MLAHINCRSFRNLQIPRWQPDSGCHLISGPNGAGKTSLLEAIYLLATTRSFRTSRLIDCVQHLGTEFHLEGEVIGDRRTQLTLGLGLEGQYRTVNGGSTNLVDHLRVLPVVAWTDEGKEVLNGPPEFRRRFMDQGIVGSRPVALETLARFRRTLFQKRRLLLDDSGGLESWNQLMANSASELMILRRDYLDKLSTALNEVIASTNLDLPDIGLQYRPSIRVEVEDPESIVEELEKVSRDEQRERRPLLGPQRDDVIIRWGEHSIRKVGSAGERKVLGLLLTAARGRVLTTSGRAPLYLLDDADSELDKVRLASIWQAFENADQVFVTASRPEIWSMAPEATQWRLEAGRIQTV